MEYVKDTAALSAVVLVIVVVMTAIPWERILR